MTNWVLRLAEAKDVPALEQLIPLSARALQVNDYSIEQIEAALGPVFGVDRQLIIDRTYYVAHCGAKIVGCGGWSKRSALFGSNKPSGQNVVESLDPRVEPARIRAFFVHPDLVRRGIARAILEACETAIAQNEFRSIELAATLTGVPLYTAAGYSVVERYSIPLTGGLKLPVVRMRKTCDVG